MRLTRHHACLTLSGGVIGAAASFLFLAPAAWGQEPPDTLAPDTLAVPAQRGDTAVADTAQADTIYHNLPELEGEAPPGWARGVWTWDHTEIMASGANTLVELVAEVPGLLTLVGGDYGTPAALSAFGGGGGGVRVIRDGFEVLPLSGGVPDLGRIGLAGVRRVRLDRAGSGLVIELWSHEYDDGRPYSLVEAGTGELDTNFFRGVFADPTALGGSIAAGLERTDTRGPRAAEPGSRTGSWIRYQLHRGDDLGVAFELRRSSTESQVADYVASVSRSDRVVRARARLAEGVVAEAYTGRSTHEVDDDRAAYAFEGGRRSQSGLRLAAAREGAWGRVEGRRLGGDGLPSSRLDLAGGYDHAGYGGFDGSVTRSAWPDTAVTMLRMRGWTASFAGLSAFGSYESGGAGSRLGPPVSYPDGLMVDPDTLPRVFALTHRTTWRVGGSLAWRGVVLSGAALRVRADSLLPLALEVDRGGPVLPGATHDGFEVWGRLPTLWEGLHLEGSLQRWSSTGPYLPEQIYRGALVFHQTYLESGNFELWYTVGVRGRGPMQIPLIDPDAVVPGTLATVPFFQHWYGRIQVRIVSMRIYVGWENLAVRRNLQDYPDRVLPHLRAVYGIRWTLWN